jgi:uncharacterized protein with FMN-binding domain
MPVNRMHRGLVALSASAVAAVYMAGYLRTQSADASLGAAAVQTPQSIAVAAAPASAPTVAPRGDISIQRGIPLASRSQAPTQPAVAPPSVAQTGGTSANSAGLKDGTYAGQGSSRRGDVWVNVLVQAGRIANVTITRSTLQYPLRDIAGLPAQVVQRQSAQVDIVSRATYSSQAFRGAVSQALSKAA